MDIIERATAYSYKQQSTTFGQSLTDETVALPSGKKAHYIFNSHSKLQGRVYPGHKRRNTNALAVVQANL